jgi:hypothetical protein
MLPTRARNLEEDRPATWACLEAHIPGRNALRIGVLLLENYSDSLHLKMRPHWWLELEGTEEYEVWEDLSEDFRNKAHMMGGKAFVDWLAESCSHVIRISSVQTVRLKQIETALADMYEAALADIYTDQLQTLHFDQPGHIGCANGSATYQKLNAPLNWLRRFRENRGWNTFSTFQTAVAAIFVVFVILTAVHTRKTAKTGNYNHQVISTELSLRLPTHPRYETVLLNLSSSSGTYLRQLKRRKLHQRPSIVRTFVLVPKVAHHPETEIAALEPPPCCDEREVNDLLPLFLQSEPDLPEIRPRRSRFVRIMARVSTPFRFIASR